MEPDLNFEQYQTKDYKYRGFKIWIRQMDPIITIKPENTINFGATITSLDLKQKLGSENWYHSAEQAFKDCKTRINLVRDILSFKTPELEDIKIFNGNSPSLKLNLVEVK